MSTLKSFLKKLDMPRYNRRLARLHRNIFGSGEGKELLLDYINRFHIINLPDVKTDRERHEQIGAMKVIQHMLAFTSCDPEAFLGKLQDNFED